MANIKYFFHDNTTQVPYRTVLNSTHGRACNDNYFCFCLLFSAKNKRKSLSNSNKTRKSFFQVINE